MTGETSASGVSYRHGSCRDTYLWELVVLDRRGVLEIANGRGVDEVTHHEALHCLVLGDHASRGLAADTTALHRQIIAMMDM